MQSVGASFARATMIQRHASAPLRVPPRWWNNGDDGDDAEGDAGADPPPPSRAKSSDWNCGGHRRSCVGGLGDDDRDDGEGPTADDGDGDNCKHPVADSHSHSHSHSHSDGHSDSDGDWDDRPLNVRPPPPPTRTSLPAAVLPPLPVPPPHWESAGAPIARLDRVPYVHGGFAAASPLFCADPRFREVLRRLMPGAHADMMRLLRLTGPNRGLSSYRRASSIASSVNCTSGGSTMAGHSAAFPPAKHRNGDGGRGRSTFTVWREEDQQLEPGPVGLADPVKLMKWAENNPVVSAFGMLQSDNGSAGSRGARGGPAAGDGWIDGETTAADGRPRRRRTPAPPPPGNDGGRRRHRYRKPALEWDVFLDPNLVRRVDHALSAVDDLDRMAEHRRGMCGTLYHADGKTLLEHQIGAGAARVGVDVLKINLAGNAAALKFYLTASLSDIEEARAAAEIEVDRQVSRLMKRTILAHGSLSQLVFEAVGAVPLYNFARVSKNVETGHGTGDDQATGIAANPLEDYEALLAGATTAKKKRLPKKSASTGSGSKAIMMEEWLSLFARALVLFAAPDRPKLPQLQSSLASSSSSASREGRRTVTETVPAVAPPPPPTEPGTVPRSGGRRVFDRLFGSFESFHLHSNRDIDYVGATTASVSDGDGDGECDDRDHHGANDFLDPIAAMAQNNDADGATDASAALCGLLLCLGVEDPNSKRVGHADSASVAESVTAVRRILGEELRLVLDLKSRRVPPRVWARLVDNLRGRGLGVEGLGSFDMDELRAVGRHCSCPVRQCIFFHSIGDLQRACHANEVNRGDTVYFNAGSLIWKRPSILEKAEQGCCGDASGVNFDGDCAADENENENNHGHNRRAENGSDIRVARSSACSYSFQPYAYPRDMLPDAERARCRATIEDYQRHFQLRIGVYVQEFSVCEDTLDVLVSFVNEFHEIYNQGLAFGGVNGIAVKNVKGDGFWNQRYMGRSWDSNARPSEAMAPLNPEDHHMVQKAIQAGAWGQVGTAYLVEKEQAGALTVPVSASDGRSKAAKIHAATKTLFQA